MANVTENLKDLGLFLAGGAVGVVVGLLVAPASGQETRRRMGRRLEEEKDELLRKGQRLVDETAERIEENIEQGKRKLTQALGR
jgi:gas vesicle protein